MNEVFSVNADCYRQGSISDVCALQKMFLHSKWLRTSDDIFDLGPE